MTAQQIKKITVATVYGKVKVADLISATEVCADHVARHVPVHLMDVMGILAKVEQIADDEGRISDKLLGTFEAVNAKTGETFAASVMYLPSVATIPLILAHDGGGGQKRNVTFAVQIFATFDEDAPVKYVYSWAPLLPPQEDDPMEALRKRVLAQKLLPAPHAEKPVASGPEAPPPADDPPAPPKGKGKRA